MPTVYKNSFITLCCFLLINHASGQLFPPKNYPQQYFQWPVAAKVALVANFGELRSNHYHMGLDMRTDQKVNVPVYAAAEGYIAKVKVEPFGFGRCIYINHPNGYTTLYAHLNNFYPALENYITSQQYKLQKWQVFLDVPADMFLVKKGDFIAYSGSTGGSQGPHVHFEIRDTKTDKVLNPTLFGFPIPDKVPPTITRLAVYDRSKSTYEQTPVIYPLRKVNGIYQPVGGKIIVRSPKVSFAISASDSYSGSNNPNGIYSAELLVDNNAVCGFEMDGISYDETRYMNAHIDYKTKSSGGPYLQHLSRLPGYIDGIYKSPDGSDGVISLTENDSHEIKIVVKDGDQNESDIKFTLQAAPVIQKNNAVVAVNMFLPGAVNVFEDPEISFYLPEGSLYDSFRIVYKKIVPATGQPIYQLHNTSVPLQNYFPIKIKADFPIEDTGKIVMKRSFGSKVDFKKAVYENGWYKARFREFGNYQLVLDKTPPTIVPIGFHDGINAAKLSRIAFAISDDTEDIVNFTATLDGKWLRFTNDKGKVFIYIFDQYCSKGQHELKIIAEDLAGNKTEKIYNFTR